MGKIVPFKRSMKTVKPSRITMPLEFADNILSHALWAVELQVFLRRRVRSFITLSTVSISFNTPIEAQEFKRLLLKRGRRN